MSIYHKALPPSTVGHHNAAEIDYHTSEAAKVKRMREQAYFNSYDFDAIEVLPYEEDDDDDDDDDGRQITVKTKQREKEHSHFKSIEKKQQQNKAAQSLTTHNRHQHQRQQQLKKSQQVSNHSTGCNTFTADNRQQHQHLPLRPVNSKNNPSIYFQRLSNIFATKIHNKNNPLKEHQQQQQQHNQRSTSSVGHKDIAVANVVGNALSHDNKKRLNLSSSETSSTTLSSSSIVAEILNVEKAGMSNDVLVTGGGHSLAAESSRNVIGLSTRTTTSDTTNANIKPSVQMPSTSPEAADSTATVNANGNSGNFLLPRAILKHQSSTLNTQQGVTGTANSMPLATKAISTSNSSQNSSNINRQQQQQQHNHHQKHRDVHKLDANKGNNAMMPTGGCSTAFRLKKTSSSSSVITSLASGDIEVERDLEDNDDALSGKLKKEEKVLPKTINTKSSARASSHQSHYSTDKSASSGYYSSNVCSTYSLEDHIYSEPTIDLKKLKKNAKESQLPLPATALSAVATTPSTASTLQTSNKLPQKQLQQQQQLQQRQQHLQLQHSGSLQPKSTEETSVMRSLDKNRRYRYAENDSQPTLASNRNSQEFSENLKILESSIENLDRHLKSFPGINPQEALVNYTQNPYNPYASVHHNDRTRPCSAYHQLPTIQESLDAAKKLSWPPADRSDDSLRDIDLDSFLLDEQQKTGPKAKQAFKNKGADNPTFLTDEQEENHYKCAKYINSCPEDAYRVESDIIAPAHSSTSGQSVAVSVDLYPKRYEEQLHFQNTRELLEDVRDKIRLLTQTPEPNNQQTLVPNEPDKEDYIPKELHLMIKTLKQELELYLERMNQNSEQEIRQLCTGLVKNQHIVKMQNAFERRRSTISEVADVYAAYETVQDGIVVNSQGVPISITQQITSIRCSSDPNFKMKRKSLTEVFPVSECYVESVHTAIQPATPLTKTTQLQRNLSYHKPVLEQLKSANTNANLKSAGATATGGDTSEPNDKDSILDWHRKKPSIWELYYGTNRIQQSLLGGKKNGMLVATSSASSPSTMCYPSSRPESDFTLDLPRAEQLRIKMEKEKKFRQRCRVITTFLSLVFFLLTVMVVSLVLTRGKRMFGSMI